MNTLATATQRKPISILEAFALGTVSRIRDRFRVASNAEKCYRLIDSLAKRNIMITDQRALCSLMEDSSRDLAQMLRDSDSDTKGNCRVFITDTLPLPELSTAIRNRPLVAEVSK